MWKKKMENPLTTQIEISGNKNERIKWEKKQLEQQQNAKNHYQKSQSKIQLISKSLKNVFLWRFEGSNHWFLFPHHFWKNKIRKRKSRTKYVCMIFYSIWNRSEVASEALEHFVLKTISQNLEVDSDMNRELIDRMIV